MFALFRRFLLLLPPDSSPSSFSSSSSISSATSSSSSLESSSFSWKSATLYLDKVVTIVYSMRTSRAVARQWAQLNGTLFFALSQLSLAFLLYVHTVARKTNLSLPFLPVWWLFILWKHSQKIFGGYLSETLRRRNIKCRRASVTCKTGYSESIFWIRYSAVVGMRYDWNRYYIYLDVLVFQCLTKAPNHWDKSQRIFCWCELRHLSNLGMDTK